MNHVQPFELGASGCAAEDSASAGRVKSIFIVARGDCLCDFALYFNAAMVGDQQIFSTLCFDLGYRERSRKNGHCGMSQQTVHPVLAGGELSVVIIVDVNGHSVRKSGKAGWKPNC